MNWKYQIGLDLWNDNNELGHVYCVSMYVWFELTTIQIKYIYLKKTINVYLKKNCNIELPQDFIVSLEDAVHIAYSTYRYR